MKIPGVLKNWRSRCFLVRSGQNILFFQTQENSSRQSLPFWCIPPNMEENLSVEQLLVQLNSESSKLEAEELRTRLRDYINYLLLQDFNKLVNVLYRVDVSENKLKQILHDDPQTDAADL